MPTSSTSTSGMSSMQVDTRERGFSYAYDAPLDMRMDPTAPLTAREAVNTWERAPARQGPPRLRRGALRRTGSRREIVAPREARRCRRPSSSSTPSPPRSPRRPASPAAIPPSARSRRCGSPSTTSSARSTPRCRWRGSCCAERRPAGRDLLPLARGPARQALPRGPRPGLHLPAGPAGLRLRSRAGGRAARPRRRRARPRARSPPTRARSPRACAPPASARSRRTSLMALPAHRRGTARRARATRAASRADPARAPAARPRRPAAAASPRPARHVARTPARSQPAVLPDHRLLDTLLRSRAWIWLHRRSRSAASSPCRSRCSR